MNGNKSKTQVVLLVSKTFLKYHPKAGQLTDFENKIRTGEKIHTIRGNFKEWEKRIKKVQDGTAVLSIKQWTSVPYNSIQVKLFEREENIGIQMLEYIDGKFIVDGKTEVEIETLAKNDGLSVQDFKDWFQVFPTSPMAVVHFTKFRY